MLYYVTYKAVVPVEVEKDFDCLENLVDYLTEQNPNPDTMIACIQDGDFDVIYDEFCDFD